MIEQKKLSKREKEKLAFQVLSIDWCENDTEEDRKKFSDIPLRYLIGYAQQFNAIIRCVSTQSNQKTQQDQSHAESAQTALKRNQRSGSSGSNSKQKKQ